MKNTASDIEKEQIERTCGDNVRSSLALSQVRKIKNLKNLVKNNVTIKAWPAEVLKVFEINWNEVAVKESRKNAGFQKTLKSLQQFQDEYKIVHDLTHQFKAD